MSTVQQPRPLAELPPRSQPERRLHSSTMQQRAHGPATPRNPARAWSGDFALRPRSNTAHWSSYTFARRRSGNRAHRSCSNATHGLSCDPARPRSGGLARRPPSKPLTVGSATPLATERRLHPSTVQQPRPLAERRPRSPTERRLHSPTMQQHRSRTELLSCLPTEWRSRPMTVQQLGPRRRRTFARSLSDFVRRP